MILLFSHQLTENQKNDAKTKWGVENFISLPKRLQNIWSNIDPDLDSINETLLPLYAFLQAEAKRDDIVLIQGDFGACCILARFAKKEKLLPVYATTKRVVEEYIDEGKSVKKSIFEHRRFREYE